MNGFRIKDAGNYRIADAPLAQGMKLQPSGAAIIRYYCAGFGQTAVAAGAAFAVGTGNLTRPFRGERLVFPTNVAAGLQILTITAGSDSVMVNALGLPGLFFAETGVGVALDFPTVTPGIAINVTGVSIAAAALNVQGGILGYAGVIG